MTETERVLWKRTILAMAGTERQRFAFINGYNGNAPPRYCSRQMLANHGLGHRVSNILNTPEATSG